MFRNVSHLIVVCVILSGVGVGFRDADSHLYGAATGPGGEPCSYDGSNPVPCNLTHPGKCTAGNVQGVANHAGGTNEDYYASGTHAATHNCTGTPGSGCPTTINVDTLHICPEDPVRAPL
ncbi:MAG: hypothetical protein AAGG48_18285 [Planctomycetota bacterium]